MHASALISLGFGGYSRFWVPGPERSYIDDLKYARGFLQLQDIIDRAILKQLQVAILKQLQDDLGSAIDAEDIGVYTQQFPYPCFTRDK